MENFFRKLSTEMKDNLKKGLETITSEIGKINFNPNQEKVKKEQQ